MTKCSNCEKDTGFGTPTGTLELVQYVKGVQGVPEAWRKVVACICTDCQKNVLTMKIVMKRETPKDEFKFEQYLPVESSKT